MPEEYYLNNVLQVKLSDMVFSPSGEVTVVRVIWKKSDIEHYKTGGQRNCKLHCTAHTLLHPNYLTVQWDNPRMVCHLASHLEQL